jgi:hypothetical protein
MNLRLTFFIVLLIFAGLTLIFLGNLNELSSEREAIHHIIGNQHNNHDDNNNNNIKNDNNNRAIIPRANLVGDEIFAHCKAPLNGSRISYDDLRELKKVVPVIMRNDERYDRVAFHWVLPLENSAKMPFGVVAPRNEHELIAALRVMQRACIHPIVRCGGHSFSRDYQEQDGWTIHVGNFSQLAFDRQSETLLVGAGLEWQDIYAYINKETNGEYSVIGGECISVKQRIEIC